MALQPSVSLEKDGVAIALILSEAEPVGSVVGVSLSEPSLQSGILVSVLGSMACLQPEFAMTSALVFLPQMAVVQLIQRAINRRAAMRIRTLRRISGGMVANAESVEADDRARERRCLNLG